LIRRAAGLLALVLFDGLTAGVTYVMQLCAVGGNTGKSDWCEPVSKMAM
jgi:hypothetical protein